MTHNDLLEVMRENGFDVEGAEIDSDHETVSVTVTFYGRRGPFSLVLEFLFSSSKIKEISE